MSYILDALKKSEQQRGDSAQSAIVTPVNPATPIKRRFAPPAILLTAVLLAAWGAIQMNRDVEHSSLAPTSQITPTSQTAMAPPSSTAPQLKTSSKTSPASPRRQAAAPVHARPVASVQPAAPVTTRRFVARTETSETSVRPPSKRLAAQSEAVPVFKPITPTSSVSRAATPLPDVQDTDVAISKTQAAQAETDILAVSELPLSVQQALPDIHIDGHIYDDNPLKRMVIINGATYREKQQIAGGLRLEEITPNGVILNFQGNVFHLGIFD